MIQRAKQICLEPFTKINKHFQGNNKFSSKADCPGGWLVIFQRSIFLGFEFRESVFFGLLNKSCILKCFIFSTVFFWVQFYSPGASIIMGLYYYHIMLGFCEMNNVFEFEGIF